MGRGQWGAEATVAAGAAAAAVAAAAAAAAAAAGAAAAAAAAAEAAAVPTASWGCFNGVEWYGGFRDVGLREGV